MKSNYKFWICIILVLVIIIGWFYWFQYRPSQIKSFCNSYAKDKAHELLGEKAELYKQNMFTGQEYLNAYEKGMHLKADFDYLYENCLHEKGL